MRIPTWFLGTEFGLYITIDGGENGISLLIICQAVHFIDLQKQTNDLVMGTHGRGVIIIDDISPLRELSDKVMDKKVHFFKSEPTVMWEGEPFLTVLV